MMKPFDKFIVICECHSPEHQLIFIKDPEDGEVWTEVHLTHHRNFFKRAVVAIKYLFGYKSRYGSFDTVLISPDDLAKLQEFLQTENNKKGSI